MVGFLCPLLVPLLVSSGLPAVWKTTLSGLFLFGIPELFTLVAVAVMGKAGFDFFKARFFGFLKRHGPPESVSPIRYRIGLVLFLLPLLLGWITPYVSHLIPDYEANRVVVGITGDIMLLVSLFVLGGEFWDKVRSLFIQGATAIFPTKGGSRS